MGDDPDRLKDICGLINIKDNSFINNMGANSLTTGGALSLACDSMKSKVWEEFSNVPIGTPFTTIYLKYLKPPAGTPSSFLTYKSASSIANNLF